MTQAPDLTALAAAVHRDVQPHIGAGRVADYIPALARIDPHQFGLAIVTCAGDTASVGDCARGFSIQSVSKVFTLALALEREGDALW